MVSPLDYRTLFRDAQPSVALGFLVVLIRRGIAAPEEGLRLLQMRTDLGFAEDDLVELHLASDEGEAELVRGLESNAVTDVEAGEQMWKRSQLREILESEVDTKEMLEGIASLWADLGHPQEWECIIYYMPAVDPANAGPRQLLARAAELAAD
jgi:hypothetical protein